MFSLEDTNADTVVDDREIVGVAVVVGVGGVAGILMLTPSRLQLEDLLTTRRRYFVTLARSFVRSLEDAEDVVQQASLLAFANIDQHDPTKPIAHWFTSIVRNSALAGLRTTLKRGGQNLSLADLSFEPATHDHTVEHLLAAERRALAEGALCRLTPTERATATLVLSGGFPRSARQTLKTRKRRTINRLRMLLGTERLKSL